MEDAGLGLVTFAIVIGAVVLFVLGVLMPWFVYRISSHVKSIREDVELIRRSRNA